MSELPVNDTVYTEELPPQERPSSMRGGRLRLLAASLLIATGCDVAGAAHDFSHTASAEPTEEAGLMVVVPVEQETREPGDTKVNPHRPVRTPSKPKNAPSTTEKPREVKAEIDPRAAKIIDSFGNLTPAKKEFMKKLLPAVVNVDIERDVFNPLVVFAQGNVESGFGQSGLAAKYNNLFGMKAGSKWQGRVAKLRTSEQDASGRVTHIIAGFRAYDSLEQSVDDYANLIESRSFYDDAEQHRDNPDLYLAGLLGQISVDGKVVIPQNRPGAHSYATSLSYPKTIKTFIRKYRVQELIDLQSHAG